MTIVYLSILISLFGVVLSSVWDPSAAWESIGPSCLSAGLAIWFWIIQKLGDCHSLRPYWSRPEADADIKAVAFWFDQTKMRREEREQYILGFVAFLLCSFATIIPVTWGRPDLAHALAAMVYFVFGIGVPSYWFRQGPING